MSSYSKGIDFDEKRVVKFNVLQAYSSKLLFSREFTIQYLFYMRVNSV